MHRRQFFVFVACGGLAAFANWASRIGLSTLMRLEYAVLVAYVIGMVIAFALFRTLVFQNSGRSLRAETTRFALVNVVSVTIVWVVTISLSRVVFPAIGYTWHIEAAAHAIGIGMTVISSYLLHRKFTFAQSSEVV